MRIDKFLKISGLIKSRKYAKIACEKGYIFINKKKAKPSQSVKKGDIITLELLDKKIEVEIKELPEQKNISKKQIEKIYRLICYEKKEIL